MRRILSIDGGGIKGVFPASFLTTLEESLGHPIAKFFDLIVGTSTGGIIALGLGLGLSAKEILSFYEEHGPSIFRGTRFARALRQSESRSTARIPFAKHWRRSSKTESSARVRRG